LAIKQKAEIYHLHDPELIPIAVLLKLFTNDKVIYDVHENVKCNILSKSWLPKGTKRLFSLMYQLTEKLSFPFIDEIIISEDSYIKNYEKRNNFLALRNYPILSYLKEPTEVKNSRPTLVYVGGITKSRGVWELIESVRLLKPKYDNILLTLAGQVYPASLEKNTQVTRAIQPSTKRQLVTPNLVRRLIFEHHINPHLKVKFIEWIFMRHLTSHDKSCSICSKEKLG